MFDRDGARGRHASIIATRLVAEDAVDAAFRVVKTCRFPGRTAPDTTASAATDRAARRAVLVRAFDAVDAVAAIRLAISCGGKHERR